jgi:CheY-like chemotaxis protein
MAPAPVLSARSRFDSSEQRAGASCYDEAQMPRVVLVHWNSAELDERAARLRSSGFDVTGVSLVQRLDLRALDNNPPDAVVIDLGRLPSHGRSVAGALRQRKATRSIPLVFVGGDPEKVERARSMLPDVTYTDWKSLAAAIHRAIRTPVDKPVVPDGIPGYSGTPLPKKLGIRARSTVALIGAPAGFERTLGTLPEHVRLSRAARGGADLILLFAKSRAHLEARFPVAAARLNDKGGLWIIWPKKTSGIASDLSETGVRARGLDSGFVDYKICAVDATWSGLLFARRRAAAAGR